MEEQVDGYINKDLDSSDMSDEFRKMEMESDSDIDGGDIIDDDLLELKTFGLQFSSHEEKKDFIDRKRKEEVEISRHNF